MIIKPTRKFAAKEIKTLGPPHTDWQISNGKITVCHYSLSMVNPIWGDKAGDPRNSDSSHHYHPLQIVEFRLISIKHIITERLYHPIDEQQWKLSIFKYLNLAFAVSLPSKASKNEIKGTKSRSSKFYFYSDWLIFFSLSNCWDFHSDCEGNLNWASLLSKYSSSGRSSSSFSCYYNLIL